MDMTATQFRKLLKEKNLSVAEAARIAYRNPATIARYKSGDIPVHPASAALIMMAERREAKARGGAQPTYKGQRGTWHANGGWVCGCPRQMKPTVHVCTQCDVVRPLVATKSEAPPKRRKKA